MNTQSFSKSSSIRYETELIFQFRELLAEDPDLCWIFDKDANSHRLDHLTLELDGIRIPFHPIFKLKPSLPWLEALPHEQTAATLLVTPGLTSRVLDYCRQHGISAIDLNGRTWLRAKGVLIDRKALPGRSFRYELEPRNIFVGLSARIVRALLTDLDGVWKQGNLVQRTQASSGLVSRIVNHLISQGFAEKISAREFRLRDPWGLLEAWAAADQFAKRTRTTLYTGLISSPLDLAHRLQDWARRESVSIAFTQWIAAWVRHPFTEPAVCSAYVLRLPESATLDSLGLRQVSEGGKLWLHVPDDKGIVTETQLRDDLTLATDAQIYLDLQRTGLRGPDAAAALRQWEGFCRP